MISFDFTVKLLIMSLCLLTLFGRFGWVRVSFSALLSSFFVYFSISSFNFSWYANLAFGCVVALTSFFGFYTFVGYSPYLISLGVAFALWWSLYAEFPSDLAAAVVGAVICVFFLVGAYALRRPWIFLLAFAFSSVALVSCLLSIATGDSLSSIVKNGDFYSAHVIWFFIPLIAAAGRVLVVLFRAHRKHDLPPAQNGAMYNQDVLTLNRRGLTGGPAEGRDTTEPD